MAARARPRHRPDPPPRRRPRTRLPRPNVMSNAAPSFQPLYLQIKALLERSLDAGEWRPGAAIPSENVLAARFGVSQGTVRKAIAALAADNLVVRRQGKGTFVATHTEEKSSLFRFLRIRRNDGDDEYPGSRLLDVRRGKASAEAARLLDLEAGRSRHPAAPRARVLGRAGRPRRDHAAGRRCSRASPRRGSTPTRARCTASSRPSSACGC